MNVILLSLARNVFDPNSRERKRMRLYAKRLSALHIIVLSKKQHGHGHAIYDGNLIIHPTHSVNRVAMLFDAYRLGVKIAQQSQPDVISVQDPLEIGWTGYFIARKTSTCLHVQLHGDYFNSAWDSKSILRKMRLLMAWLLLKRSHAIRVVSERIRRSLMLKGIPESRITVLPIRPELEQFLNAAHAEKAHDPFVFLAASRFSPEKDISRMIHAFWEIAKDTPHVRLRLIGKGNEERELRSLVKRLHIEGKVDMMPWTEAIAEEMGEADVFLLASKHEAYALTLVEAMAVGLPLVTTDVGCVGDVVKDGVHGIVVKEPGVPAFAAAMRRMVEDGEFRRLCGRNGKETARKLAMEGESAYVEAWVTAVSQALKRV